MTDARPAACMRRRIDEGIAIPPTSSCYVPGCDPTRINSELCYSARPAVPPEPPASWGNEPPAGDTVTVPKATLDATLAKVNATAERLAKYLSPIAPPCRFSNINDAADALGRLITKVEDRAIERRQLLIEQYEHLCEVCDRTPQAIGPDTTYEAIFGWFTVTVGLSMMPRNDADWTDDKLHVPTLRHVDRVLADVAYYSEAEAQRVRNAVGALLPKPPMSDDERAGYNFWAIMYGDGFNLQSWHDMNDHMRNVWIERAKRYEATRNAE